MDMVRSFLAIELPEDLILNVLDFQNEFKKTDADIKYVSKDNMHLTLKFFGNVDLKTIEEISEEVELVLENFYPFDVSLSSCGAFPSEEKINAIWVGTDNNKCLHGLQKQLDYRFKFLGFRKERKYQSHLTIGRMKSSKCKNNVQNILNSFKNEEFGQFKVEKVYLKKSSLTPKGPIYENIKVFKV